MTEIQAYVFVDTENPGPKRIAREIRELPGVIDTDSKVVRWID
jgi:hypothetical protein